jgi:gliding motility-associated-like protein
LKKALAYLLFIFCFFKLDAKHIVGGEIIYDDLGGGNYRITLKVYRDCFGGGAAFDGLPNQPNGFITPAILTVYDASAALMGAFDIGAPVVTPVPSSINNPCIQPPNNICVEQGIYTYTLNLPQKTGGYYIIYQRCCRNTSIVNLLNPGDQGATYYTKIPGPEDATVNSSPRFNKFPPIYLCNMVPFSFDHAATDPDGDQLVYSLCTPYQGLSSSCPGLGGNGCPTEAPPPPYTNVVYTGTYSGSYPIASNPAFNINSSTGLLMGTPNLIGQFVVSVCIQEIRNGKVINVHYRDFQFNVSSCNVSVISIFKDPEKACQGKTINFVNQSFGNVGQLSYHWDFGVTNTNNDTSSLVNPSYTYPDTGTYEVTLIANPNKPCSDTMKKRFYIYPELGASFLSPGKQCLKGNSFTFTNTSNHDNSAVFNWYFTANATPSTATIKNPSGIVFNQAGKYTVKMVGKQFVCRDSITDTVRVIGRPMAKINNLPESMCDPARIGFSNGSSSELPVTYNWLFSNGASSQLFEPVQVFSPPGVYGATLIVTTSTLCVDTSIASVKNITVNPSPEAAFNISPSLTTIFDPEVIYENAASDDVAGWQYSFGDGLTSGFSNGMHEYPVKGNYVLSQVVSNTYGCTDTAYRELKVLPEFRFWIPNSFTPNFDNLNDVFMPKAIGVLDYKFDIYNKWGERIFKTTDPAEGWDGSYKGKPCEQDVYVWKITFTNEVTLKFEEHVGIVTLIPKD